MTKKVVRNEPNDLDKNIAKALSSINGNMNFSGFNKRFVNNIQEEAEKGLSDKQQNMAVLILCRYRRQIPNFQMLVDCMPIELKSVVSDYMKSLKTNRR